MRIGGLLLAAGSASRMGRPKQALFWQGRSLLEHAAQNLSEALPQPAAGVVVLGSGAKDLRPLLSKWPLSVLIFAGWERGMRASLRYGLMALPYSTLDAVLVTLGDQPLVTATHLRSLLALYAAERPLIAASTYSGTRGVPVVFARELFAELLSDPGNGQDLGAKSLLKAHADRLVELPLPEAAIDIDTPADYAKLLSLEPSVGKP